MPEGRQSPSPSRQSGAQLHDAPASGHGIDKADDKQQDQLKNLESNPAEGPMDKSLKEKFKKTEN